MEHKNQRAWISAPNRLMTLVVLHSSISHLPTLPKAYLNMIGLWKLLYNFMECKNHEY